MFGDNFESLVSQLSLAVQEVIAAYADQQIDYIKINGLKDKIDRLKWEIKMRQELERQLGMLIPADKLKTEIAELEELNAAKRSLLKEHDEKYQEWIQSIKILKETHLSTLSNRIKEISP